MSLCRALYAPSAPSLVSLHSQMRQSVQRRFPDAVCCCPQFQGGGPTPLAVSLPSRGDCVRH